jgi:hypothetical protein
MLGYDSMVLGINDMGRASQNEIDLDRSSTAATYTPGAFKDENAAGFPVPAYGAYTQTQPAPMPASTLPGGPSGMPVPVMQAMPGAMAAGEEGMAAPSGGLLGLPTWAWIAGGGALALLLVGGLGVAVVVMKRR